MSLLDHQKFGDNGSSSVQPTDDSVTRTSSTVGSVGRVSSVQKITFWALPPANDYVAASYAQANPPINLAILECLFETGDGPDR